MRQGDRVDGDTVVRDWDLEFVQRAARFAEDAHADDRRKGTDIPYVAHLWSVAALVMEHGGNKHQVAAALLHDVVEDHGGAPLLTEVHNEFGGEVADMVAGLSDSLIDTTSGAEKPPWPVRKLAYLDHLELADDATVLVSAADKLHNLRAIVADYRSIGPELWARFNQSDPAAHRWYYGGLVERLAPRVPPALAFDLRRTLDELDELLREIQPAALEPWSPATA